MAEQTNQSLGGGVGTGEGAGVGTSVGTSEGTSVGTSTVDIEVKEAGRLSNIGQR